MYSPSYKALQEQFHIQRPDYGISGSRYTDTVLNLAKSLHTRDILDYGCGKATLAKSLPFPIQSYDPFLPEYSARPNPADLVVCTDVMEHVEHEHVNSVLSDIFSLTKKVAFFQIATTPAKKDLPDGRNAHITLLERDTWLINHLLRFFQIEAFQAVPGGFFFMGSPK